MVANASGLRNMQCHGLGLSQVEVVLPSQIGDRCRRLVSLAESRNLTPGSGIQALGKH
jgi:hypothetical protein